MRRVGTIGGLVSSLATQLSGGSFPASFLRSLKEGSTICLISDDGLEPGSPSGGDMVPVAGNSPVTKVDWRELVAILQQLSESEILETVAEPSEETRAC